LNNIGITKSVPIALSPRQRLGLLQRLFAGEQVRPQPPARQVVPTKELGCPAVGEADLEGRATVAQSAGGSSNLVPAERFSWATRSGSSRNPRKSRLIGASIARIGLAVAEPLPDPATINPPQAVPLIQRLCDGIKYTDHE